MLLRYAKMMTPMSVLRDMMPLRYEQRAMHAARAAMVIVVTAQRCCYALRAEALRYDITRLITSSEISSL